jgi:hypothetical protein
MPIAKLCFVTEIIFIDQFTFFRIWLGIRNKIAFAEQNGQA